MDFHTLCPGALRGSALAARLEALDGLYAEAAAAEAAFIAAARSRADPAFGCPSGCGSCCDVFVPDILPAEADYLALWLLAMRPGLAAAVLAGGWGAALGPGGCPLREPAPAKGQGHCGAYGARPLVCRLFGFSGVISKRGLASFALCKHAKALPGRRERSFEGGALADAFGAEPPLMSDYGERLVALDPDSAGERLPLPELLPRALARVGLLLSMARAAEGGHNDDGGAPPEPNAPMAA